MQELHTLGNIWATFAAFIIQAKLLLGNKLFYVGNMLPKIANTQHPNIHWAAFDQQPIRSAVRSSKPDDMHVTRYIIKWPPTKTRYMRRL
jgi:hypothetical protein